MIALILYYAPSTQCTLSSDPPCSTYIFSVHSSITREITSFDDYNLTRNWEDREGRDVERGETQQSRVWSSFWSLCINEVWKEKSCRVLFLSFVCDVDCLREKLWHKRWSIDGIFEESARQKDWIIKKREEGNHNVFTRRTRDEKKVVMAKKKKKRRRSRGQKRARLAPHWERSVRSCPWKVRPRVTQKMVTNEKALSFPHAIHVDPTMCSVTHWTWKIGLVGTYRLRHVARRIPT